MLHSQAEPALGAGKHCAGGQHDFPQPWWSMCRVWNFIAVTESLLFFNFIFTSKCGRMASATVTATGTWWRRNRSPRLALLVFFTTSHPYLWEAVVMFLPLPYLSPTHCMCVCVHIISHVRLRARHGAHSQTTQSVTTSRCAKDRKSDLQNSEGTLGSFSSKCLVFSSAGQTKSNKGGFHFSSLSHLLSRNRMISSMEDRKIIHWLYQIELECKLYAWYWVRDKRVMRRKILCH